MKKIVILLTVILGMISLTGCKLREANNDDLRQIKSQVQDVNEAPEMKSTDEEVSTKQLSEITYEPVTGDNITVALEFVKDIMEENFDKLTQAYQYDELMKEAMSSADTQKMIVYYNSQCGTVKEIKEAYTIDIASNQQVMVPVKYSNININYCIVFNKEKKIISYSYADYVEKAKTRVMPDNVVENEYKFISDDLEFSGTLTTPKGGENYPIVILVHGSGPNDRDESIYQNKPFRDIAWDLAEQGIASYRFDKRTFLYAKKVVKDKMFTVEDESITDVVAAVKMVSKLDNIDETKMFILGHSLGGYLIPRIAAKIPEAAGFIIMSGPAQHMKDYILEQYNFLANEDGVITTEEKKLLSTVKKQVKLLNKPDKIPEDTLILGSYKNYWIDLKKYDAIKEAKKITRPVLVLQGERDYQVTMKQFNLWKATFGKSDNWNFKTYKLLNHLLMAGTGKPSSREYQNVSYVDHQVTSDIAEFIHK